MALYEFSLILTVDFFWKIPSISFSDPKNFNRKILNVLVQTFIVNSIFPIFENFEIQMNTNIQDFAINKNIRKVIVPLFFRIWKQIKRYFQVVLKRQVFLPLKFISTISHEKFAISSINYRAATCVLRFFLNSLLFSNGFFCGFPAQFAYCVFLLFCFRRKFKKLATYTK